MRDLRLPTAISYDVPLHPGDRDSISLLDTLVDESYDPDAELVREERRREIRAALRKMRPQERITILLRVAGYTLEEVGQRMGVCRERARQWERDAKLVARGEPRYTTTEKYKARQRARDRSNDREANRELARRQAERRKNGEKVRDRAAGRRPGPMEGDDVLSGND